MASRRAKVAGVALGLLAGLGGGLYGYRAYALRKVAAPGTPAAAAPAAGAHAQPSAHPPDAAAPEAATPAEREARLLARLDATAAAPAPGHAPEHGSAAPASPAPPGHAPPPAAAPASAARAPAAPRPGSAAAREADLMRRAAEGQLPAAAQPLFRIGPIAAISAEGRAQADSVTHGLAVEAERRTILSVWPPIADAEPPPGPPLPVARPPPPRPRPPRLELPSRLDQWGE